MWYFGGCSEPYEELMTNCIVKWVGECDKLGLLSFHRPALLLLPLKTWDFVLPKIVITCFLKINFPMLRKLKVASETDYF